MNGNNVQPATPQRQVMMEDVQRMIGALTLENDLLRRENALLRQALEKHIPAPGVEAVGAGGDGPPPGA